jgi:hypothetical protein
VADHTEDALIREVNDELREEQMMKLWQRYGGFVVGVALLVVVIVAGYQGWKHYTTTTRQEEGERFYAALQLADTGNIDDAIGAFQKLSGDASTGYGVLAQFQQAILKSDAGDIPGAVALYAQIAKEQISEPTLSGLAAVLGATLEINAGGYDRAALELRLQAISGDGQPYRYTARELLGLIALDAGDTAAARTRFDQLANDAAAPQAIAQRAGDIVQSLGAQNLSAN